MANCQRQRILLGQLALSSWNVRPLTLNAPKLGKHEVHPDQVQ